MRLVADGLTNRAVTERVHASSHTVSGHLRHAFGKPGVNSRVGLTCLVAEHRDAAARLDGVPDRAGTSPVPGTSSERTPSDPSASLRHPGAPATRPR